MAVRDILRMSHPILRQAARPGPVDAGEWHSERIHALVSDMRDTLRAADGMGLAAPQVGAAIQLAIIDIPGGERCYGGIPPLPFTAFINPQIDVLDPTSAGYWEGCLSVPGLLASSVMSGTAGAR